MKINILTFFILTALISCKSDKKKDAYDDLPEKKDTTIEVVTNVMDFVSVHLHFWNHFHHHAVYSYF